MFKKSACTLGVLLAFGAPVAAHAKTTINIGHGANEQYYMHRALLRFEELVEAGSNGEFNVQIFPSSQLGPDREMIEGVQTGVLEMALAPSSFLASWDPAFAVIELPYLYASKAIALDTLNGEASQGMLNRLEDQSLVGLALE